MTNFNDAKKVQDNPFNEIGMIKFWLLGSIFWLSFPFSILIFYLFFGLVRTKQLVAALVNDFFQTVIFILILLAALIYLGYLYIPTLF